MQLEAVDGWPLHHILKLSVNWPRWRFPSSKSVADGEQDKFGCPLQYSILRRWFTTSIHMCLAQRPLRAVLGQLRTIPYARLGNSKGDPWVFSHSPLPLPFKTLTLDKGQGFEQGSRFPDPYPYPLVKPFTTLEGFHVKEGHKALTMSE